MTEIVGSKRRINVVAQGLEDIVLDPGTITGYRSKAHRIAMFLRKHFNPELTRPVSGLTTTTTCFSLLPPHFTREDLEIISELWPTSFNHEWKN